MEFLIIISLIAFLAEAVVIVLLLLNIQRMQRISAENEKNESIRPIVYCNVQTEEEKKAVESIFNAIENNEFKMYLQFIVDNNTKKIMSAEALSRWDNPHKGIVGPGYYIGIMEESGLISKHDYYMFELACRQLQQWSNTDYKDISISCNFTRITLSEQDCVEKLKAISEHYKFDRSKLALEITEDAIEKDTEIAKKNVKLCKELGFKIYLDDLGSGCTSLSNLCDYPIDVVKIDRDILLKATTQRGKDLFSGIIALAHSLNMSVICEGVETEEQNTLLSKSNCDFIQGWYYAKALPLEECEFFMENYNMSNYKKED